jgi:hypothetical protein
MQFFTEKFKKFKICFPIVFALEQREILPKIALKFDQTSVVHGVVDAHDTHVPIVVER